MGTNGFSGDVGGGYADYLRDESRRTGHADSISFPATEDEIRSHLRRAAKLDRAVTVQGGRTGIAGGAVPEGGHVLNLSRMNRCLGLREDPSGVGFLLSVQPGLLLADLRAALERASFDDADWSQDSRASLARLREAPAHCFPPDPTETSASIGGMATCNASGARSFAYGPTRCYVSRLRAVLANGGAVDLRRGVHRADGRAFSLGTGGGPDISGTLPALSMPEVKNAAGYYCREDMDLLDLFIGSEGTLGVLSALDIRLVPRPHAVWGVVAFVPSEPEAVAFVKTVRAAQARPAALEFLGARALALLQRQKQTNPAFRELPDMPPGDAAAVYVEYHGADEEAVESSVLDMSEALAACGGDPDATWLASDPREMQRLKDFRHAVPEAVNLLIDERRKSDPRITKLGTDLAVPDDRLTDVLALYRKDLGEAGLEYVIFGHIGDNHLHVNIIPRSCEEYERGKTLYLDWARAVVAMGGTVSAEHGIGKLKTALLREMLGDDGIRRMMELKRLFDPEGRLNRGNLFPRKETTR